MFYQMFMAVGLGGEFTRPRRLSAGKLNSLHCDSVLITPPAMGFMGCKVWSAVQAGPRFWLPARVLGQRPPPRAGAHLPVCSGNTGLGAT